MLTNSAHLFSKYIEKKPNGNQINWLQVSMQNYITKFLS